MKLQKNVFFFNFSVLFYFERYPRSCIYFALLVTHTYEHTYIFFCKHIQQKLFISLKSHYTDKTWCPTFCAMYCWSRKYVKLRSFYLKLPRYEKLDNAYRRRPPTTLSSITGRNQIYFYKKKTAWFLASLSLATCCLGNCEVFGPVTDKNICTLSRQRTNGTDFKTYFFKSHGQEETLLLTFWFPHWHVSTEVPDMNILSTKAKALFASQGSEEVSVIYFFSQVVIRSRSCRKINSNEENVVL